jgi:GTP cyclohydrolase I
MALDIVAEFDTPPDPAYPHAPDAVAGDREHAPDLTAAERAAAAFLTALGVGLTDETRRRSARRMAHAYAELFAAEPFAVTTFPNDGFDGLIQARSIPLRSVCEHHLMPFAGIAHVGYLPGERIIGLSKLARVVDHVASRPQVQERITTQIADWLERELRPQGIGVVVLAEHTCMTMRGARATGTDTVTSTFRGLLAGGLHRQEFMSLVTAVH